MPVSIEKIRMTTNITKHIFAIRAAVPARTPKPRAAATIAKIRNRSAFDNIIRWGGWFAAEAVENLYA